ncbi:MAG: cell division protein FtsX [Pseudomonadota bacterium]
MRRAPRFRIVPSNGSLGWLVGLGASAAGFLAVLALAFGLAALRLSDSWDAALAGAATVRITGPEAQIDARIAAVLKVLKSTPGIAEARLISSSEQAALLTPWLGETLPLQALPVPRLVAVALDGAGPDAASLAHRLAGEAPGAVYEEHGRWQSALSEAAQALTALSAAAIALTFALLWGLVALGARAALDTHRNILVTLRMLGADDAFISRSFLRRMVGRTVLGTGLGAGAAAAVLAVMPEPDAAAGLLTGLAPQGAEWAVLFLVPLAAALAAYIATRLSVRRVLGGVN